MRHEADATAGGGVSWGGEASRKQAHWQGLNQLWGGRLGEAPAALQAAWATQGQVGVALAAPQGPPQCGKHRLALSQVSRLSEPQGEQGISCYPHPQTRTTTSPDTSLSASKFRTSVASNLSVATKCSLGSIQGALLRASLPPHKPLYLSPSSSVFSRLRSITTPTVLANLCGEWGTPAGRRNICSGGTRCQQGCDPLWRPQCLQGPEPPLTHGAQPSPPLCNRGM